MSVPMYDKERHHLIVITLHFILWCIIGTCASTLMVMVAMVAHIITDTLGRVLYFTSPDDPALCVSKMKGHGNYQSLLGGHFTISEVDGEKRVWTSSSQSNIDYISIAFSSGPCPLLPTIFTLWQ